jgi:hypothetical protein
MVTKRILLLLVLILLFAIPAMANQAASGWCESGAVNVTMQGLTSSNQVQGSFPSCTVTVLNYPTGTSATIYSNNNVSPTPLGNPFQAQTNGYWQFYAADGHYTIITTFTQPGAPAVVTYTDVLLFDSAHINPQYWIDPTNAGYGAKCDGATDDQAALQAALNAAVNTGLPLQLPPATCVFSGGLFSNRAVNIQGTAEQGGTASNGGPVSTLKYTGTGTALNINNGTTFIYGVHLSNFFLLGATVSSAGTGIACTYCNQMTLDNVFVSSTNVPGFTNGFDLSNTAGLVAHNMLESNSVYGTRLVNSSNIDIDACNFYQNTVSFLLGGNISGISIHDCVNIERQDYVLDWDDNITPISPATAGGIRFGPNNFVLFDGSAATYPHQKLVNVVNSGTNFLFIGGFSVKENWVNCPSPFCASPYAMNFSISATTNAGTSVSLSAEDNEFVTFSTGGITSNSTKVNVSWLNNTLVGGAGTPFTGTISGCVISSIGATASICPVTGITTPSVDGIFYIDGIKFTNIDAALTTAPCNTSSGCKIILGPGSYACPTVFITTPIILEGSGSGGYTNTSGTTFASSSVLSNTSQTANCINIGLPGSNQLTGVLLRNFAISGNKNVGGASSGDNISIVAGGSATSIRNSRIENVASYNAFGNGLSIKEDVFEFDIWSSQFMRNGGHGIAISNSGTGQPSQINLVGVLSDLNTGDALNMNGTLVHDVTALRSTFADSNNGVNIVAGTVNATLRAYGCDFENNTVAGVNINDGFGHILEGNDFPGDSHQQYGVNFNPPGGAGFVANQLVMRSNNLGGTTVKDINVTASAHVCTIYPQDSQSGAGYSYADASGNCTVLDSARAATLLTNGVWSWIENANGAGAVAARFDLWDDPTTHVLKGNANGGNNHNIYLEETGSCAMAATTTCTFNIGAAMTAVVTTFSSIDAASTVPATANSSKCSVSGTVVTITAGISNSLTWDCLILGR